MLCLKIDKTYSLQDIADRLKRPRTTLTNWASTFKGYLPVVGTGRTKRYKEESIEIFQLIMELKDRNEPNEVIEQYLQQTSSEMIVYDEEQNQENMPLISSIVKGYENVIQEMQHQNEFLAKIYQEAKNHNSEIIENMKAMREEHKKEMEEIKASLNENNSTQKRLDSFLASEEEKQAAEENAKEAPPAEVPVEANKPWFQRVFRKKDK